MTNLNPDSLKRMKFVKECYLTSEAKKTSHNKKKKLHISARQDYSRIDSEIKTPHDQSSILFNMHFGQDQNLASDFKVKKERIKSAKANIEIPNQRKRPLSGQIFREEIKEHTEE